MGEWAISRRPDLHLLHIYKLVTGQGGWTSGINIRYMLMWRGSNDGAGLGNGWVVGGGNRHSCVKLGLF